MATQHVIIVIIISIIAVVLLVMISLVIMLTGTKDSALGYKVLKVLISNNSLQETFIP
jgi:hypothetical protein